MKEKVAVKFEIHKRGMISLETAQCSFCKKEPETVSHLFFHCSFSWSIWASFLGDKNVGWCCPEKPFSALLSWVNLLESNNKPQWTMLFFTVLWSLWLFRNQMVFNAIEWDFIQLVNIIKCRYAYWFDAKWPMSGLTVEDILRGYDERPAMTNKKPVRVNTGWQHPHMGSVKFNVDGSSLGKPGPAGIGGLLRDSEGNVLAIFSKSIGSNDSNAAEIIAIVEAVQIFISSRWANLSLVVESDSKNAVSWANNHLETPWRLRNLSNRLCNLKQWVNRWSCVHIYREANTEADQLAKQGVNRENDLVSFL